MTDITQDLVALRLKLRARGFRPVPVTGPEMTIKGAGKATCFTGWQHASATPDEVQRWAVDLAEHTNTGLLMGGDQIDDLPCLVALDLDVNNPELIEALNNEIIDRFGGTDLIRIGRAPREAHIFRTETPLRKMAGSEMFWLRGGGDASHLSFEEFQRLRRAGELDKAQVEVLGQGQQLVAFGIHPDTREPFRWPRASPLDVNAGDLPLITREGIQHFLARAELILLEADATPPAARGGGKVAGSLGLPPKSGGDTTFRPGFRLDTTDEPPAAASDASQGSHRPGGWGKDSEERVAEALSFIDPDIEFSEWLKIGMALYDWDSVNGPRLWDEWSSRGQKYEPGVTVKHARTFASGIGVRVSTLFYVAKQCGWKPRRSGALRIVDGGLAPALRGAQPPALRGDVPPSGGALPKPQRDDDEISTHDFVRSKSTGLPKPMMHNARIAFGLLGIRFEYDEFQGRIFCSGEVLGDLAGELSDFSALKMRRLSFDEFGFDPGKDSTFDCIYEMARSNPVNPVTDYLDALVWDGVPRIDAFLSERMGVVDSPYTRAVSRLLFRGLVERARRPGCKFDTIIVLEGYVQGMGKSSALRLLSEGPQDAATWRWPRKNSMSAHFCDETLFGISDKERIERLVGNWLCEVPELAGMSKADSNALKAFASRQEDAMRPAYGRTIMRYPRQGVIVGTTNDTGYLRDPTGNRRFLPVLTKGKIDLEAIRSHRDQLFAEAAAASDAPVLPEELWPDAADHQKQRLEYDPWVDVIANWRGLEVRDRVLTKTLLIEACGVSRDRLSAASGFGRRIAAIMPALGWKPVAGISVDGEKGMGWRKIKPEDDDVETPKPKPTGPGGATGPVKTGTLYKGKVITNHAEEAIKKAEEENARRKSEVDDSW